MIDFRYHLVSLISVFLALAVGIALGAGPLKETIGDTLTGQVEVLRTEKEQLRAQLDETTGDLAAADAFVAASADRLLSGVLTDRRVALVVLDEVSQDAVTAVGERIDQAGGSVSATVTVNDTWTDPGLATYRRTLAGTLVSYLAVPPPADAGTDVELAEALVSGLVGADSAAPDVLSENAASLLDVLAEGDRALVSFAGDVTRPAAAIVVLAGTPAADPEDAEPTEGETPVTRDAQLALVAAAQRLSEGVVVAGDAGGDSLVSEVRADDTLTGTVSTVSDVERVTGQVTVPLALAAQIGDQPGHYGYGDDLEPTPPVVTLAPVDRTPADAGTEADAAGDATGADASGGETGEGEAG